MSEHEDESKRQQRLFTWVAVIVGVMLALGYGTSISSKTPMEPGIMKTITAEGPSGFSLRAILLWSGVSAVIGFAAGHLLASRQAARSQQSLLDASNEISRLVGIDMVDEAITLFKAEVLKHEKDVFRKSVCLLDLSVAKCFSGRFEEAVDTAGEALAEAKKLPSPPKILLDISRRSRATAYALAGDVPASKKELERISEETRSERCSMLMEAEIINAIRSNKPDQAVRLTDDDGLLNHGTAAYARHFMELRLLRAFALSQLENAASHEEEIRYLLEGLRPHRPELFRYLASRWPEMRAFLEQHGLGCA